MGPRIRLNNAEMWEVLDPGKSSMTMPPVGRAPRVELRENHSKEEEIPQRENVKGFPPCDTGEDYTFGKS